MVSTFRENGSDDARRSRVIVYTLRYDDLLAGGESAFVVDDSALPFHLGRAADESPPRLVSPTRLALPDRWASSEHCRVEHVGTSDVVLDDGSRNGTLVNGERVERYRVLTDGDLLEVGHSLLCYRLVAPHTAAALAEVGGATRCPELAAILRDLRRIAASREPVLLIGEAGVGKKSAARAVHEWSGRGSEARLVECDAATDVARDVPIAPGTVVLDGLDRLSDAAQSALLRVVESERAREVRWVATMSDDPFAVATSLRSDLLRAVAGYVARLPPLRRRREDLGSLCAGILRAADLGRVSITPAAARALFLSTFAGNIRQLRTVLRAAATLAGGDAIDLRHLPPLDAVAKTPRPAPMSLPPVRRAPTVEEIVNALQTTGGNIVRTAECLNTHPRQVYRWIERHEIKLDQYRR